MNFDGLTALYNRLSEIEKERMIEVLALIEIAREQGINLEIDEVPK